MDQSLNPQASIKRTIDGKKIRQRFNEDFSDTLSKKSNPQNPSGNNISRNRNHFLNEQSNSNQINGGTNLTLGQLK
jgi:hypothetical protein